ncbi:hypothetical protein GRI62_08700 [Erythrobacter arachoides]|uniref:Uncharacterized protein n=1 Tax=Aurantiacibacter arachoides TaxID=1850444 RepID=A0A845A1V1_9SPHN|nr:hypothetical protein [Aurantiacibacter arachoides]MXO93684.1 hypothetical protein [Aurantiacibacter arachoides]GGD47449.1 hypothetical protein GCM10011411_03980 [Aurantiacibacter arachoides]
MKYKAFTALAAGAIAISGCTATTADAPMRSNAAASTSAGGMAMTRIGDAPNFNGVWQVMNSANWNLEPHSAAANPLPQGDRILGAIGAIPAGLGVIEGGTIPYNEAAQERLALNRANVINHDPEAACYLPGIPRATYMPHPFQIVQGDGDDILMVYEYASANRVIHMGEVGIPPIDTWMGTSYGRWDGDTLVVTTLAQGPGLVKLPAGEMMDGVTWLDRAGNYLTNTATVIERFTMDESGDHMDYSVSIEDPTVYTRPWTINMTLYRAVGADAQLLEFKCVPFSENLLYGDLIEGQGSE